MSGAVLQCFVFEEEEGGDGIGISYPQAALVRVALRKVLACDTLRYMKIPFSRRASQVCISHRPSIDISHAWKCNMGAAGTQETEGRNVISLTNDHAHQQGC